MDIRESLRKEGITWKIGYKTDKASIEAVESELIATRWESLLRHLGRTDPSYRD